MAPSLSVREGSGPDLQGAQETTLICTLRNQAVGLGSHRPWGSSRWERVRDVCGVGGVGWLTAVGGTILPLLKRCWRNLSSCFLKLSVMPTLCISLTVGPRKTCVFPKELFFFFYKNFPTDFSVFLPSQVSVERKCNAGSMHSHGYRICYSDWPSDFLLILPCYLLFHPCFEGF